MRILGLDYGAHTVGVAASDELFLTAQPVETIRRERENAIRGTLCRLETLARGRDVALLVLGLPLNMDGSEGERAAVTRAFGERLKKRLGLPVVFSDERLTSVEAEERLREQGLSARQRAEAIDTMAAVVILEEYLGRHREALQNGQLLG